MTYISAKAVGIPLPHQRIRYGVKRRKNVTLSHAIPYWVIIHTKKGSNQFTLSYLLKCLSKLSMKIIFSFSHYDELSRFMGFN